MRNTFRVGALAVLLMALGVLSGCSHDKSGQDSTAVVNARNPEIQEEPIPECAKVNPDVAFTPREGCWANYALRQTARISVYNTWARKTNIDNGYIDAPPGPVSAPKLSLKANANVKANVCEPCEKRDTGFTASVAVKAPKIVVTAPRIGVRASVKAKTEVVKEDECKECQQCKGKFCMSKSAPRIVFDIQPTTTEIDAWTDKPVKFQMKPNGKGAEPIKGKSDCNDKEGGSNERKYDDEAPYAIFAPALPEAATVTEVEAMFKPYAAEPDTTLFFPADSPPVASRK